MDNHENIFQKPPEIDYKEEAPPVSLEEFKKVITSRRSVRVFNGDPIPTAVMEDCLDMALLAPNSSNLQPWEFYWVKTPEKKKQLQIDCFSQVAATSASELIVAVAHTRNWKNINRQMLSYLMGRKKETPPQVFNYYKKLVPFVYTQGPLGLFGCFKKLLFSIVGLFKVVPREPTSQNDMKIWAIKSTALACENLMLALRAYGYDSCAMEGFDSVRVKKLLALPSDACIVMVIGAGKRVPEKIYGRRLRFSRDQFIKMV